MSQLQQSKQTRQLLAFDTTMAGVSSTGASSGGGAAGKFSKEATSVLHPGVDVSRAAAPAWVISASSFASNLIDSSFAVSKDGRAAQQTWCSGFQPLVKRTSHSRLRPQLIRKLDAKVLADFLLDSARKKSGEGPLQSPQ